MSNITKTSFVPVQGKEATLRAMGYNEGWLYFATDTKRIFLDSQGIEKMPMGGNSGVYYGQMVLDETPDENQIQFNFTPSDLEVNNQTEQITIPNIDDLILNIPDGCFYRITDIEENQDDILIITDKLTIAGSGSFGDGSEPVKKAKVSFDRITEANFTTLAGSPCWIKFKVTATDSSGEMTLGKGTYRLTVNGVDKATGYVDNNDPNDENDFNQINIQNYLTTGISNDVKIYVTMDTGGSVGTTESKRWQVISTAISLDWSKEVNEFNRINSCENLFELECTIKGGLNIDKTVHILIDGAEYPDLEKTTNGTGLIKIPIDPVRYGLGHGRHLFEIYLTVNAFNLETPHIQRNLMFAENDNPNYIINYDFYDLSMSQYDTVKIPVTIYGKNNSSEIGIATVVLSENLSILSEIEEFPNGYIHEFNYTPKNSGIQMLTLTCEGAEEKIYIDVSSLNLNIEEVKDYTFKFQANEFSDNLSVKNWKSNNIIASFSDRFDWINGGLKSEKDDQGQPRQYFCIKSGSTMTVDYNIFKTDARGKGKCFKVIFKATKCKDYDAQVLSCYDKNRGLTCYAQNAIFNSNDVKFNIPYCEDRYIEFELDIAPTTQDGKKQYIKSWLDGVPVGVKVYDENDSMFADNSKLIIGSEDCDVYIYMIKLYERHLSDEEHLTNFIMDAPNALEMKSRYLRNDILDERGEISPIKLAEANPNCRVHMYEMRRMTRNKKDPIDECIYTQYHGSSEAAVTAENVTVKVQGTSSAAYGLAAFNLDSKFNDGFKINGSDTTVSKWAMTENSIPVNYFCTKVNVASAEQANNALNQEWYNRYQPYKTVVRGKNDKARDTMEFTPGVLFIKDLNPQTNDTEFGGKGDNVFKDTLGYCDNFTTDSNGLPDKLTSAYYKMYSVCNMGNSKENIEVFHDAENPLECCIENGDNQLPGQRMIVPQGAYKEGDKVVSVDLMSIDEGQSTLCPDGNSRLNRDLWETGMDEIYSFRYPDGISEVKKMNPEYSEAMITGWFRLVKWMAENNPQPAYERIKFYDGYYKTQIKTQEDFDAEVSPKFIYLAEDENYIEVNEFKKDIVYYIHLTQEQAFNREILGKVYKWDSEEHKSHIEIDVKNDNYNENHDKDDVNDTNYYFIKTQHIYGATDEKLNAPVVFGEYTFEGYKPNDDNLNQYQADYTPLINGCIVDTYAKEYTHDTTDYRMAKMLSECEQYLCMDSIIFHYLFIERHSMIDNVAKNTFWSTEDGMVWNLTKDYDNDTADGNNNQGKLELTYGCEPGDVDSSGVSIFNAGDSVWLFFIRNLYQACKHLYLELDKKDAWSSTTYLKEFENWQSAIPERCWIEDYYRKYIRPLEVYEDDMFLEMMEGGKKTHQRAQYETYQNYYISSKYFGSSCSTNHFIIRANSIQVGQQMPELNFPVKLYADCYLNGSFGCGQDTINYSRRSKRSEDSIMIKSPIDNVTDATVYLYSSNMYQELGNSIFGLSELGLEQFSTSGAAKKLRVLSFGTANSGISNDSLSSFSIGGCENLEELYVANLNHPSLSTLNLENSLGIKMVDASGSTFTSFVMPDGAPLHTLIMHRPKNITLSNLTDLERLSFNSYNNLSKINIDNIDNSPNINSKKNILDKTGVNLEETKLLNVKWEVDSDEEIDYPKINALEKVMDTKFVTTEGKELERKERLTGLLTINSDAFNTNNSINIYNRYFKDFPNLDIIFLGDNAKLPKVSIYNGNDKVCWQRRISNGSYINSDFLSNGPNGTFSISDMIYKQSSESADYEFNNKWIVYFEDGTFETYEGEIQNYSTEISQDISFKPQFEEKIRYYTLRFYTYNTTSGKVDELIKEAQVPYGTELSTVLPEEIPYKPEDPSYQLKEANDFIGYGITQSSITPVKENIIVRNSQDYYAIFKKVNDITKIVHYDWFDFMSATYTQEELYKDYPNCLPDGSPVTINDGVLIMIRSGKMLRGKITIPSKYNGKPVIAISNQFAEGVSQKITHVFCEQGSNLCRIGENAFRGNSNLIYFDFSQNTVRYIGKEAFFNCTALDQTKISLSENLFFVGKNAFNGAFISNSATVTLKIPYKTSLIEQYGFGNMNLSEASTIQIGEENNKSRLYLSYPNFNNDLGAIQKFSQNPGHCKNFIFFSERYSNPDNYVPDLNGDEPDRRYQVMHAFMKDNGIASNINLYISN